MFERTEEFADAVVYRLNVRVLDGDQAPRFTEQIEHLPLALPIILDLSRLDFADSSGIGCILSLQRSLLEDGVGLSIVGLRPRVRDLFELVQLHRVVDVFNDVDEARRTISAEAERAVAPGGRNP